MPADDPTPGATVPVEDPAIVSALDELQRRTAQRRAELAKIAAALPATISRRTVLRSIVADIRQAPNKTDIAGRGLRKLGRAPRKAARLVKQRVVTSRR